MTASSRALVAWALEQPGVACVRATIPPGHAPSLRVAAKIGMRQVGTAHDGDVGDVIIFELREPDHTA